MADDDYIRQEREEADRLRREIADLVDRINSTNRENVQLECELKESLAAVFVLSQDAARMAKAVDEEMHALSTSVGMLEILTEDVFKGLVQLTNEYFTYKNLSTATKNLSEFTDEYSTKYYFYNDVRRITIGFVIGVDQNMVSSESMRKKVEKAYLQNTDYWLVYCITAVMFWMSDDPEAAKRALNKSLSINYFNSCLFYLLINLRFNRIPAAKKWYIDFFNKSDSTNLGDEWQYLLQAYLSGVFGSDEEFQTLIVENLKTLFSQIDFTTVDFSNSVSRRAFDFADAFIHKSEQVLPVLKRTCSDYEELHGLLSKAEKVAEIARYYNTISEYSEDGSAELPQRIENLLYSLVNNYDENELEIIKKLKYNEAIISAKGDLSVAQKNFEVMFGDEKKKKSLANLLLNWAFSPDTNQTDLLVKKFSISLLKAWLIKGFDEFAETYRKKEKEKYTFNIGGFQLTCGEQDYEGIKPLLEKYYEKNLVKDVFSDKQVMIYIALCGAALLSFVIIFFSFSEIILSIGILTALAASFLLWQRIVDIRKKLEENKRKGVLLLKQALAELTQWRESYKREDKNINELQKALQRF